MTQPTIFSFLGRLHFLNREGLSTGNLSFSIRVDALNELDYRAALERQQSNTQQIFRCLQCVLFFNEILTMSVF